MKRLLLLMLLAMPLLVVAQSHLYSGSSTAYSKLILTFDGKHIYKGSSTFYSKILFTIDGWIPIPVLVVL